MRINAFHRRLIAATGYAWLAGALALAVAWGIDDPRRVAASFAGMAIGAAAGGIVAERRGRRDAALASIVVIALGSVASAGAPPPDAALVGRAIVGIGAGAALVSTATLLAELAPSATRGAVVTLLGWSWAIGAFAGVGLAALASAGLLGRIILAAGAVPAVAWPWLRRAIPESPRWLAARRRFNEADAIVRRAERAGGGALITVARVTPATAPTSARMPLAVRRTFLLGIVWIGVGVALARIPPILVAAPLHTLLDELAAILLAFLLADRLGRRATLCLALLCAAVPVAGFVRLSGFAVASLVLALAYTLELVPGQARATVTGTLFGICCLAAAAATLLPGPPVLALLLVAAAVAAWSAAPEPRGRSLEDSSGG